MRNLLRKPLPWMVVAECAIVAALAMVAWHLVASPPAPQISGVQAASPTAHASEPEAPGPKIVAGKVKPPVDPLLPGLNIDSTFWRLRLAELNRGESSFEQLEWRIVHSAMDAARHYVKSVVLPALARAERAGR
ncbi:MAG TPA: hypothetical protein VIN12_06430 [Candidatus Dormibacteraeota bacterium]|jgi:hypothetical protein